MSRDTPSDTLTDELRDRLAFVERQLEAERQAHAEARRIIAGLVDRLPPAIEPPSEAREPPVSSDLASNTAGTTESSQGDSQQRYVDRESTDKVGALPALPLRQYVSGIALSSVAAIVPGLERFVQAEFMPTLLTLALSVIVLLVPGYFGYQTVRRYTRPLGFWRYIGITQLLMATGVATLGLGIFASRLFIFPHDFGPSHLYWRNAWFETLSIALYYWLPVAIVFASGALIGNARHQRSSRQETWTARKGSILGFTGTLVAALINFAGTLLILFAGGTE